MYAVMIFVLTIGHQVLVGKVCALVKERVPKPNSLHSSSNTGSYGRKILHGPISFTDAGFSFYKRDGSEVNFTDKGKIKYNNTILRKKYGGKGKYSLKGKFGLRGKYGRIRTGNSIVKRKRYRYPITTSRTDKHRRQMKRETVSTTRAGWTPRERSSAPPPITAEHHCDIVLDYCLRLYDTGAVCGRTVYYEYQTFDNFCIIDYLNCMERHDIWQGIHMGQCMKIEPFSEYIHYQYEDDYFLDRDLIIEDM